MLNPSQSNQFQTTHSNLFPTRYYLVLCGLDFWGIDDIAITECCCLILVKSNSIKTDSWQAINRDHIFPLTLISLSGVRCIIQRTSFKWRIVMCVMISTQNNTFYIYIAFYLSQFKRIYLSIYWWCCTYVDIDQLLLTAVDHWWSFDEYSVQKWWVAKIQSESVPEYRSQQPGGVRAWFLNHTLAMASFISVTIDWCWRCSDKKSVHLHCNHHQAGLAQARQLFIRWLKERISSLRVQGALND